MRFVGRYLRAFLSVVLGPMMPEWFVVLVIRFVGVVVVVVESAGFGLVIDLLAEGNLLNLFQLIGFKLFNVV